VKLVAVCFGEACSRVCSEASQNCTTKLSLRKRGPPPFAAQVNVGAVDVDGRDRHADLGHVVVNLEHRLARVGEVDRARGLGERRRVAAVLAGGGRDHDFGAVDGRLAQLDLRLADRVVAPASSVKRIVPPTVIVVVLVARVAAVVVAPAPRSPSSRRRAEPRERDKRDEPRRPACRSPPCDDEASLQSRSARRKAA
jgi:hypothetical protein